MSKELQAEYSVIGALLINNDAIDDIPELEAKHFADQTNRAYFAEIKKQIERGNIADVVTVAEAMQHYDGNVFADLNQIQSNTPGPSNIRKYAETILNGATRRFLLNLIAEYRSVIENALNPFNEGSELAAKIDGILQLKNEQEPELMIDLMPNYIELVQNRLEGKVKPMPTGFEKLDEKLGGGLDKGTLTVVAGRPAMGKTAFALSIARNVSFDESVLFFSMEMPKSQVIDRNVAALGKIPMGWLKMPNDNPEHWNRLTTSVSKIQQMKLNIDDETMLTMAKIRSKSRRIKRKRGLSLIIIDQLSFITGSRSEKSYEAVGEYTRGAIQIAKELDVPVILLAQLNRECEKRHDKRPMLSDLATSGSIEQDANTIMFLYRDEVYNPDSMDRGICEVIISKQRQGENGTVPLEYHGAETRFADLARPWSERKEEDPKRQRRGIAANL